MCVNTLVREICKLALNVALSYIEFCQLKDFKRPFYSKLPVRNFYNQIEIFSSWVFSFSVFWLEVNHSWIELVRRNNWHFCDMGSALEGSLNKKPVALVFITMVSTCQHCEKLGTLVFFVKLSLLFYWNTMAGFKSLSFWFV